MKDSIWVVNAFTDDGIKGNPAGVCFVEEFPDGAKMLEVSAKLGFSNSAFVKTLGPNNFQIRWFTPNSEAPICGHATIAASHILFDESFVDSSTSISFESKSGELSVKKNGDWYALNFPAYHKLPQAMIDDQLLKIVGHISPIFYGIYEKGLFMEFSEAQVRNMKPDLEELKKVDCRALTITARSENNEYDFISRYFAPREGIDEDPVCASAHCALIPYWSNKLQKSQLTAYQASARGGLLKCENNGERVIISGKAKTVFKGSLFSSELTNLKAAA